MNSQSQWQVVSCKCCLYSVQIISLSVKYTIFYKIAVIVIIKIQKHYYWELYTGWYTLHAK